VICLSHAQQSVSHFGGPAKHIQQSDGDQKGQWEGSSYERTEPELHSRLDANSRLGAASAENRKRRHEMEV
jgi:hypothetical protein